LSLSQESKTGSTPPHLSFFAEDNIFGPPQGAWFTMMEEAFGGVQYCWI
jgi:hypothetical protein